MWRLYHLNAGIIRHMIKLGATAILLTALLLTGCKEKEAATTTDPAPTQNVGTAQPDSVQQEQVAEESTASSADEVASEDAENDHPGDVAARTMIYSDMNDDGLVCLPDVIETYASSAVMWHNSKQEGDYYVATWDLEQVPVNFDNSGETQNMRAETVTAYMNLADPEDFMVRMDFGTNYEFDLNIQNGGRMCSRWLNLPKLRQGSRVVSGRTVWLDAPSGPLYMRNRNPTAEFSSETYLKKHEPNALYQWLPMVDFALR